MPRATRSCRGSSTAHLGSASRSSPCTPSTPQPAAAACAGTSSGIDRRAPRQPASAGHVRARRRLPLDGEPGDRRPRQHRRSATRSAGRRSSPGQRFAARLADDPPGQLTLREAVLVEGEAAQTDTLRWEDYAQTAIDPVRRLHDLVRRRLPEEGRHRLFDEDRRLQSAGLPCTGRSAAGVFASPASRPGGAHTGGPPARRVRPYRSNNDLLSYDLDVRVDPAEEVHQRHEHDPLPHAAGRLAHSARPGRGPERSTASRWARAI